MRYILIGLIALLFIISFTSASYTTPAYTNVTVVLANTYTAPSYTNVTIVLDDGSTGNCWTNANGYLFIPQGCVYSKVAGGSDKI